MSDSHEQFRFDEEGELEPTEAEDEEKQLNDFGKEMPWYECKSGIRRDLVSSLLQKAVRRSDEEVAGWAAWEMQRSGHGANLWSRLALFAVEELRAGSNAILILDRYHERLDDESSTSWRAKLLAIHAALTAARADSTREATILNGWFDRLAKDRARAEMEEDHEMMYEPVVDPDEISRGGRYDVALDKHSYPGAGMGRGWRHFQVHGARCSDQPEWIQDRWRKMLKMDQYGYREYDAIEFTDAERQHAAEPVDPKNPWRCEFDSDETLDEFEK